MIIKTNKIEEFLKFYKLFIKDIKNNIFENSFLVTILEESNCSKKEDMIKKVEIGTKDYFFIKSYLSVPFYLVLSNEEMDRCFLKWEGDIFSIDETKLENILDINNKKYLSVYAHFDGWVGCKKIFEAEK